MYGYAALPVTYAALPVTSALRAIAFYLKKSEVELRN